MTKRSETLVQVSWAEVAAHQEALLGRMGAHCAGPAEVVALLGIALGGLLDLGMSPLEAHALADELMAHDPATVERYGRKEGGWV